MSERETTGGERPWGAVWLALQELGAAIDAIADQPDWLISLGATVEAAQGPAEEYALEEDAAGE